MISIRIMRTGSIEGTAGVRVIRIEFLVHLTQIEHGVDLPDQMIGGHDLVELKGVEKLALSLLSAPHHGPLPSMTESIQRNHGSPIASIGVLQQNQRQSRHLRESE